MLRSSKWSTPNVVFLWQLKEKVQVWKFLHKQSIQLSISQQVHVGVINDFIFR